MAIPIKLCAECLRRSGPGYCDACKFNLLLVDDLTAKAQTARAEGWNAAIEACARIANKEATEGDYSCMASEVAEDIERDIRALSTAKANSAKAE